MVMAKPVTTEELHKEVLDNFEPDLELMESSQLYEGNYKNFKRHFLKAIDVMNKLEGILDNPNLDDEQIINKLGSIYSAYATNH